MRESLRIAPLRWDLGSASRQEELQTRARSLAIKAQQDGAELIILPELFCVEHFGDLTSPQAVSQFPKLFTEACSAAQETATSLGCGILWGTWPVEVTPGKIRNRAIYADPNGKLFFQDKLSLTPEERAWGWQEGDALQSIEILDGLRATILICHDVEFPDLSSALVETSPELLLVPSLTTDAWGARRVGQCSAARSVEHFCFTAVSGVHGGGFFAAPAVYSPQSPGWPSDNSCFPLIAELDLGKLRRDRGDSARIYPARDQRMRGKRSFL